MPDLKPLDKLREYMLAEDRPLPPEHPSRTVWCYERLTHAMRSEAHEESTVRPRGLPEPDPHAYAAGICARAIVTVRCLTRAGHPGLANRRRFFREEMGFTLVDELAAAIIRDSGLTEDEARD